MLYEVADPTDPLFNEEEAVADFVTAEGTWDVEKLNALLPSEAVEEVIGMSIPQGNHGEDVCIWGGTRNGEFSIKTTYSLILNEEEHTDRENWRMLWNWKGPNRIRFFLWILGHDRLLSNAERLRRHLTSDGGCIRCAHGCESTSHIFRDCNFALEFWRCMGFQDSAPNGSADFKAWLKHNLTGTRSLLFDIGLWQLWKARNELVFNGARTDASGLSHKAHAWSEMVSNALLRDARVLDGPVVQELDDITWEPGPIDRITINTDGSVNDQKFATAGGVLRSSDGKCLKAFSSNLGRCSVTRVELQGAIHGLELAWNMGFRRVELQMDSSVAIDLFMATEEPMHQHAGEVLSFRELRTRDWSINIRHLYREGNKVADFLANRGHDFPFGSHSFPLSDCNLSYFLRYDCLGISEPRHVLINN
ncbi:Putative ribonuclease H protein At1g65750 [Linum perenne]